MLYRRLVLLLLLFSMALYAIGSYLVQAKPSTIGSIPSDLQNVKVVSFPSQSGSQLSGWLFETKEEKGGVLLLHGVKSNRLQMLNRAKFLQEAGYTVLIFDFQAHGKSSGDQITFGYLESMDANAAYEYLADSVSTPNIGVIGVSLGGASVLLGEVKSKANVMILESVYPTIKEAIDDRLKIYLGEWGSLFSPLLTLQLKPRLGIGVEMLRPIDHVKSIKGATLFIIGSEDRHTTVKETKKMFSKAKEPKELWVIKDKGHISFDKALGTEYNERVLKFLDEWINQQV